MASEGTPVSAGWFSARVLNAVARVHPDERRDVAGAFFTLFGFMAGHALLETGRDALFLASIPASQLPWVYLAIAVVALTLAQRRVTLITRFTQWHELTSWLVFAGGVTAAFWGLIWVAGTWIYYALYTWTGVLATLVVVRFWTALGDRFTVTQAKRLFAIVGTGSVLGAIMGSALARVLTAALAAQHVVAAAAVVFGATALAPRLWGRDQHVPTLPPHGSRLDVRQLGTFIWERPYLRRVATFILFATVVFTLVDFIFKLKVSRVVPDEELGAFFASVYLVLNALSLLVQLFLVGWLLRRVGVNLALALVPLLLVLWATGFAVGGTLPLVLLLKGTDGALRHSLYRTGTELLFVPLAVDVRGRAKAFVDVVGQRGGQAAASLLILAGVAVTTNEAVFGLAAAIMAGVWLSVALGLKRHYLDVFRETLADEITETRIRFPALDLASLETLLATLNSTDDRRVLAAMDVLVAEGKVRVIPGLILYHPSPAVVVHALDLFVRAGREDCLSIAERLNTHADEQVRAAALRFQSSVRPDEAVLRAALQDPSATVQSTAAVGLAAAGWQTTDDATSVLNRILVHGSPAALVALSHAIRLQPGAAFRDTLITLATDDDASVRLETVRAMREVKDPAFVSPLIEMLAQRVLRGQVQLTLVAIGPAALVQLVAALRDARLSHGVRRHLPRAIATFGSQQAADALLSHLLVESDGMIRFKILRALGQLRGDHPELRLDHNALGTAIKQTLSVAFQFMRWRQALEDGISTNPSYGTALHQTLVLLLQDKQRHAVERLFRLLNLQAKNEDFFRIYRGLRSIHREARAGSRELLEHLVFPPVKQPLLRLLDDLDDSAGSALSLDDRDAPLPSYGTVLQELLASSMESLSSIAARHTGELELHELRGALERCNALSSEHAEVLTRARRAFAPHDRKI